jgi:hypothetical protein
MREEEIVMNEIKRLGELFSRAHRLRSPLRSATSRWNSTPRHPDSTRACPSSSACLPTVRSVCRSASALRVTWRFVKERIKRVGSGSGSSGGVSYK